MSAPEFYYEWGNEPRGYVSTGLYVNGVFSPCGQILKTEAISAGLYFHCPYN